MSITSLLFAACCLIVILIYWHLPSRYRTWWLFAVSVAFLITWSWELAAIMLVVATVNFYLGHWLGIAANGRRSLLWIGIGFNVIVLVALKYSDFYVSALTRLVERLGFQTGAGGLQLLAPVGLSFATVQMISYLVDINERIVKPEARWMEFALYVVYFPKMLSGPVERARVILPRIKQPQAPDSDSAQRYFWLIVMGVIRKIVLANTLSVLIPADAFVHPNAYQGQDLLLYLLTYAFAIYNDFAGYTSIVRGISGFLGIELTSNFKLPYFSRNFNEFWERWHISLSNWLRDYIFFPVSRVLLKQNRNREHVANLVLPPLATMLVSGMWHGLGWNFLLWGGLHSIYLIVERVTTLRSIKRLPDEWPKWRQAFSALGVFAFVILAWIPFRMDVSTAWQYFLRMARTLKWIKLAFWFLREKILGVVAWNNWVGLHALDIRILVMLSLAFIFDWMQYRHKDETFFAVWPAWAKALSLSLLAMLLIIFSLASTGTPFIYQGF